MTISEYISELKDLKKRYGDVDVMYLKDGKWVEALAPVADSDIFYEDVETFVNVGP